MEDDMHVGLPEIILVVFYFGIILIIRSFLCRVFKFLGRVKRVLEKLDRKDD